MIELASEPLLEGIVYPEGPRWHEGRLWLSDMFACRVLTLDEQGATETVIEVPGRPSGLGFLPDGTPLVVSMTDRRLLRIEGSSLVEAADLSGHATHDLNDMLVDDQGRAYVGNFGCDLFAGDPPAPTDLFLVLPDGTVEVAASDLIFPNGMVLSADGATLTVAESFGGRITAFDVDADGRLSNRRTWADVGERTPDGIAADAEGGLWISSALQSEYVRLDADGTETHVVPISGGRIAQACALGGADGHTLFMLIAETTIPELGEGRSKGFVETAHVEAPAA